MNKGVSYSMFYEILLNLREYFHSYGRIDDSNGKLDEIVKLISINYELATKGEKFSLEYFRKIAAILSGNSESIAEALIWVFKREAADSVFINDDGTNIFGANPSLALQPSENEFAEKLISEIEKIDFVNLLETKSYSDFDIINECFGHFVRENFRNNKEDAQYMTPYEISQPILDIIFHDMQCDGYFTEERLQNFVIMDPTCGVGTLLIESSNHFTRFLEKNYSEDERMVEYITSFRERGMIGQDKVDRMVRLSKINALLLGCNISNINSGNSIIGESNINKYLSKVDLIFTNPPFGAEYSIKNLNLLEYPILSDMCLSASSISSELLMLDKSIALLKDNGYLAIVLPDSVFASKGINSLYRDEILKRVTIRGVIELPSVTFAQAGTRTNTCVLYLQKKIPDIDNKIFMATCTDLGYIVKEKMGVPVKIAKGNNEMLDIAIALTNTTTPNRIVLQKPSVTYITQRDLIENVIKPSFYGADKFLILDSISSGVQKGFAVKKLSEVAEFVTTSRKGYMVSDEIKHISVLHVNSNCTINFNEVEEFVPVSKGRTCQAGDLIFSKLNPRIPRMAVVPDKEYKLVCSNEFEIIRPRGDMDVYTLCFLLRTSNVMIQIASMTSGTSSSHSRIKREQLGEILIPVPVSEERKKEILVLSNKLREAVQNIYNGEMVISEQQKYLSSIF